MAPTLDDEGCAPSVPFHEKAAWFTLVSAVLIYSAFATRMLATPAGEQTVLRVVVAFTIAITVQGVIVAIAKPLLALRPVHPIHDATVGSIEQILFIVRRGAPPQTGIEHDRAHASRRRFGEWNPVAQHMNSSNGKFVRRGRD